MAWANGEGEETDEEVDLPQPPPALLSLTILGTTSSHAEDHPSFLSSSEPKAARTTRYELSSLNITETRILYLIQLASADFPLQPT